MNPLAWKPPHHLPTLLEKYANDLANKDLQVHGEDGLSQALEPLINAIEDEKNSPLTKLFLRGLGNKDVKTGDKLDCRKIAKYLISLPDLSKEQWKTQVTDMKELMLEISKKFVSNKFENQIPKHFKNVSEEELDAKFSKGFHGVASVLQLISKLKELASHLEKTDAPKAQNLKNLILDLEVWCFHYLVVAAKPPFIANSAQDRTHLAFSEYMHSNDPSYHREDGGAIKTSFLELMKTQYPWIKTLPENIDLIKNKAFPKLIVDCCDLFTFEKIDENSKKDRLHCGYVKVNSLDTDEISFDDHLPGILFLDISNWIKDQFESIGSPVLKHKNLSEALKTFLEDVSEHAKNREVILGCSLDLAGQECYFFQSNNQLLLNEFKEKFKDLQGSNGAHSEIILLKRILINAGFNIKEILLTPYPIKKRAVFEQYLQINPLSRNTFSKHDVKKEIDKLIEHLKKIRFATDTNPFSSFYIPLFYDLLNNMATTLILEEPIICETIVVRLRKIRKLIDTKICSNNDNPSDILMNCHLVIEHILFLLIFYKPPSEKLIDIINDIEPTVNSSVNKRTYLFTSGIACYGKLIDAIIACQNEYSEKSVLSDNNHSETPYTTQFHTSKTPEVFFDEQSYYELLKKIELMDRHFHCSSILLSNFKDPKVQELFKIVDMLFFDFHPNRVIFPIVKTREVENIIKNILEKRDPSKKSPFLAIIDCSTTIFFHEEIKKVIAIFSKAIEEKKLVIILTNSFAKFFAGFDKIPAGIVQIYGACEFSENICNHLNESFSQERISKEATRFFSLLLKHCRHHIINYLSTIRENTNEVYEELKKEIKIASENEKEIVEPVQVGFRTPSVPMIGFHFDYLNSILYEKGATKDTLNMLVLIMQYYFFSRMVKEGLPVTIKQSFGFSVGNLVECYTALRQTIGLEKNLILKYSKVVFAINKELKEICKNQQIVDELRQKITIILQEKNLKEKVSNVHVSVLNHSDCFEDIVNFFYNFSK